MAEITTIKLQKETKKRLENLREHKRETYDDILRKMLGILNIVKADSGKAIETLNRIDEIQKKFFRKKKIEKESERAKGKI